jgi:hypothetical protein
MCVYIYIYVYIYKYKGMIVYVTIILNDNIRNSISGTVMVILSLILISLLSGMIRSVSTYTK